MNIENSKVKQFTAIINLTTFDFETKNEFDFIPAVAKYISTQNTYGFIEKTQTSDHYLENIDLVESANYYYSLSQIVLGSASYFANSAPSDPMMIGSYNNNASGVITVCRDILVSKFDKTGKLVKQYLLPRHTGFMTVSMSRGSPLFPFENRQRNVNYILKNDDLHIFYLDNLKNTYSQSAEYIPSNTKKCVVDNGALTHMSVKNDKVEKEILVEKNHRCYFYSAQNMVLNDVLILDLEGEKKGSELGRVIIN